MARARLSRGTKGHSQRTRLRKRPAGLSLPRDDGHSDQYRRIIKKIAKSNRRGPLVPTWMRACDFETDDDDDDDDDDGYFVTPA